MFTPSFFEQITDADRANLMTWFTDDVLNNLAGPANYVFASNACDVWASNKPVPRYSELRTLDMWKPLRGLAVPAYKDHWFTIELQELLKKDYGINMYARHHMEASTPVADALEYLRELCHKYGIRNIYLFKSHSLAGLWWENINMEEAHVKKQETASPAS